MPAPLIRMTQKKVTPRQLDEVVEVSPDKITLRDYLNQNLVEKVTTSEDGDQGTTVVNMAAFNRRYELIKLWHHSSYPIESEAFKAFDQKASELLLAVDRRESLTDRFTVQEPCISAEPTVVQKQNPDICFPNDVLNTESLDTANNWLRSHCPDTSIISDTDWELCCDLAGYLFDSNEPIPEQKAKALINWLKRLNTDNSNAPATQLLKKWCAVSWENAGKPPKTIQPHNFDQPVRE